MYNNRLSAHCHPCFTAISPADTFLTYQLAAELKTLFTECGDREPALDKRPHVKLIFSEKYCGLCSNTTKANASGYIRGNNA